MQSISAKTARHNSYPLAFSGLLDKIASDRDLSMPALVFYLINKKQSGFHKIVWEGREMMYENYDEAANALAAIPEKEMRQATEIRCGLFVEGPSVRP